MNEFDLRLSKIRVDLPNGKRLFSFRELNITHGRHILIQGESGKGKTTLLHLIAGLFSPTEGYVYLGERQLFSMSEDERCDLRKKSIGVIFQKLNLIDHLTVEENVSLAAHEQSREGIDKAITHSNLKGKNNELCGVLSLGEQQRVAVARVLAQKPEIILADEPTSSLDQHNAKFIINELKSAASGKTLIVVSHDHRIEKDFDEVIQFEELIG